MSPISDRMRSRYDCGVQTTIATIEGALDLDAIDLDHLSEVKGMFNRCVRQDQWDWYTVHEEFGFPPLTLMRQAVRDLLPLRKAVANRSQETVDRLVIEMVRYDILTPLYHYQDGIADQESPNEAGWLYILSRRDDPTLLKIGMTTRSVAKRVKEINSATGILVPFSARNVFRVQDARTAEKAVHQMLDAHRVRQDREFFRISFGDATRAIRRYMESEDMAFQETGTVARYFPDRGFGFITPDAGGDSIYFHIQSVVENSDDAPIVGGQCRFVRGRTPRGEYARRVQIHARVS